MSDPLDMNGKVVIVTGGARGVGRGITERFLEAGAEVLICGRNEPESLPHAGGRSAHFEAADVRCVVMPPEYADAPALLGGTFINRFGYKIDTGTGTLTLHRLDDGRDKRK